jgi:hypothetical protein
MMNIWDDPRQVVVRFYRKLDEVDVAGILSLVTDDVQWSRPGRKLVGSERVKDNLLARSPSLRTCHVVTNLIVEPGIEGSATVSALLFIFSQQNAGATALMAVDGAAGANLKADLIMVDGAWRIRRMCATELLAIPEARIR